MGGERARRARCRSAALEQAGLAGQPIELRSEVLDVERPAKSRPSISSRDEVGDAAHAGAEQRHPAGEALSDDERRAIPPQGGHRGDVGAGEQPGSSAGRTRRASSTTPRRVERAQLRGEARAAPRRGCGRGSALGALGGVAPAAAGPCADRPSRGSRPSAPRRRPGRAVAADLRPRSPRPRASPGARRRPARRGSRRRQRPAHRLGHGQARLDAAARRPRSSPAPVGGSRRCRGGRRSVRSRAPPSPGPAHSVERSGSR